MRRVIAPIALLISAVTVATACGGASGEGQIVKAQGCEAGVRECQCQPGLYGTQPCYDDGNVGACVCQAFDAGQVPDTGKPEGGTCGDFICNATETCADCPRDCGQCPVCDLAPSCTGAVAVPTNSTRLAGFDNNGQPLYTCGTGGTLPTSSTCLDPKLRIRLRKLTVTYNGQITGGLDMYCIVNASDGATSEMTIVPQQNGVHDGDVLPFDPSVALLWGQKELHTTINNLTITYRCFEASSADSYKKALDAASNAAVAAGGVAGPWGWAFGLGSVAASVASAAINGSDTLYLNVQQTIDASALLDLTNGRTWNIQQNGTTNAFGTRWNWTLEIESWGCADARPTPH